MKYFFSRSLTTIRNNFIIHPILLAVFFVLFLYSRNMRITVIDQAYLPGAISILGAVVVWLLLYFLLKDNRKAALAASLVVLLFFAYGRVHDVWTNWGVWVPKYRVLLLIFVFILGYGIYFIKISRTNFKNTTRILNFVTAVLVLINLVSVGIYQIGKSKNSEADIAQVPPDVSSSISSSGTSTYPDIYYLILDEYAHPDTMKEYYNYDCSEFINNLKAKGFYYASESKTTSMTSYQAVTMPLNMDYIDINADKDIFINKLENSRAAGFLQEHGYRYIYIGSWYDMLLGYEINADIKYNTYKSTRNSALYSEFSRALWNTTMLRPFFDTILINYYRNGVLGTFNILKNLPDTQKPKFVFAHILAPHEPIVFGVEGETVFPDYWYNYKDQSYYLNQYRYTSKQVEILVEFLIEKSKTPPIIIVQSDHGLRPSSIHPDLKIGHKEWMNILNMYYLPGDATKLLYPDISPVNSFRIIFNYYFGADYELLDDK